MLTPIRVQMFDLGMVQSVLNVDSKSFSKITTVVKMPLMALCRRVRILMGGQ